MSNWLFMAYPAAIFSFGMGHAWIAIGLVLGMFINWQFIARRLRTETERFKSYTLSTYFEGRLQDTSGTIRMLTALMTLFYLTWYLAAGMIGLELFFESVLGINYLLGLSISVTIIIAYTFYGGYITVAWTELFQALFLLLVLLIVPVVAYTALPGTYETIRLAALTNEISLQLIDSQHIMGALFLMAWGLGYWGQPHILTKFMGISDVTEMNKAKWLGMAWQVLCLASATAIGIIGIGYFVSGVSNPELIFIELVKHLFHPFVAGIILCAILAATMSYMSAQILVAASILSEDLYKRLVHPLASEWEKVLVSRIGVVLIGLIALGLSTQRCNTVLGTVDYAWTGLGSAFGPLLLMCLYSTSITRVGGIAGIVTGGLMGAFWYLLNPYFSVVVIPAMIPSFFCSFFAILLFSRLSTRRG